MRYQKLTQKQRDSKKVKKAVVNKWLENVDQLSKAAFSDKFGISPRTLGRWVDKYSTADTVAENTATVDAATGNVEKPTVSTQPTDQYDFVISPKSVTLIKNGSPKTVMSDNSNYNDIVKACVAGNFVDAWDLCDIATAINKFSHGAISVVGNDVFYGTFKISNKMTERLLLMISSDMAEFEIKAFCMFMTELFAIENRNVIDQLWPFLETNHILLNADGTFTGYRAVTRDFMDKHTGTIDNSVGSVPTMPRSKVNHDPSVSCSYGLHVGSLQYARGFARYDDNIIAVKCHVRDVVSVPFDYSGGKLRACRYEVVKHIGKGSDSIDRLYEKASEGRC